MRGCVNDGRRTAPSPGHLCTFAAAKAHAAMPQSARSSTRPRALAPTPDPQLLRSDLKRLLTHRGGCLRASEQPGGFLCSRHPAFLKTPRGPPTAGPRPRAGRLGAKAPPPAPGWHRGRCHLGLAPGAVLTAVLPRGRSMETNGTGRRVLGPVPGRHRAAGLPPLQAQAGARRGLARPGPRAAPGRRHYLASVVFPEPGRPRRR